jgi:hypothetical protein
MRSFLINLTNYSKTFGEFHPLRSVSECFKALHQSDNMQVIHNQSALDGSTQETLYGSNFPKGLVNLRKKVL